MTPEQFSRAGRILLGAEWKRKMAQRLAVQERNVLYWAAGSKEIPPGVASEIYRQVMLHAMKVNNLLQELALSAPPAHGLEGQRPAA